MAGIQGWRSTNEDGCVGVETSIQRMKDSIALTGVEPRAIRGQVRGKTPTINSPANGMRISAVIRVAIGKQSLASACLS